MTNASKTQKLVNIAVVFLLAQTATGYCVTLLLRSRILADRAGGTFAFVQYAWDYVAGTWGSITHVSSFLLGIAVCSWFWLFTVFAYSAMSKSFRQCQGLCQAATWAGAWAALVLALPAVFFGACWIRHTPVSNGRIANRSVILSFDAEEDWSPRSDMLRMGHVPSRGTYFATYEYVDSGQLELLATGLAHRGIKATFYCTPNLVEARSETIRRIADLGHEIGLHLHGHNLQSVEYPYVTDDLDDLANWRRSDLHHAIEASRRVLEHRIGGPVKSFRSGGWATGWHIVNACKLSGFTNVSHLQTTLRLANGLWQIETTHAADVLARPELLLEDCALTSPTNIIPVFSHPMILWDRSKGEPRRAMIESFFNCLDELRRLQPDLRFVTAGEVAAQLEYIHPSLGRVLAVAVSSLLMASAALLLTLRCWCKESIATSGGV